MRAGKNYFVRYRYKGELSPNGLWEISEAEFRAKTKKLNYANLKELFDARLHMTAPEHNPTRARIEPFSSIITTDVRDFRFTAGGAVR